VIRAGKRVEVVSIAPFESAPQQFVRWDVAGPGGREVGASAEAVVGACLGLGLHVAAAHAHGGRAYEAQGYGAHATLIVMQTPDLGLPDLSPDAVPRPGRPGQRLWPISCSSSSLALTMAVLNCMGVRICRRLLIPAPAAAVSTTMSP